MILYYLVVYFKQDCIQKYNNGIDWEEVAESLNTNRMPFHCFRRYQERWNPNHRKFGWTKEDNIKLLKIISNYKNKTMSDIEWEEVRLNFPGRSKTQIYAYVHCVQLVRGFVKLYLFLQTF